MTPTVGAELDAPRLSVVVASWCDETRLLRCLASLAAQPMAIDVLVATSLQPSAIGRATAAYPHVQFSQHTDANVFHLRAIGAGRAEGEIVAIIEDHVTVRAGWANALIDAFDAGHGVLGGPVDPGQPHSAFEFALYFVEYGMHMTPVTSGNTSFLSGVNVAYGYTLLERTKAIWRDEFMENEVNDALAASEIRPYMVQGAIVTTDLPFTLAEATNHLFEGARHYALYRSANESSNKRWLRFLTSPFIVPVLFARLVARAAQRQPGLLWPLFTAIPYVMVLLTAWASGERAGYARSTRDGVVKGAPS